jgi:hypothetical protein
LPLLAVRIQTGFQRRQLLLEPGGVFGELRLDGSESCRQSCAMATLALGVRRRCCLSASSSPKPCDVTMPYDCGERKPYLVVNGLGGRKR